MQYDFLASIDLFNERTPSEILLATKQRLRPDAWTKAAVARDARGRNVKPLDPNACCWCVEGALAVESNPYGLIPPILLQLIDAAAIHVATHLGLHTPNSEFSITTMAELNDMASFEVVHAALDVALEYANTHPDLGAVPSTT